MKIKFKEQEFQIDAAQAVVDCFEGQPLKANKFTLQRSKDLIKKAKEVTHDASQTNLNEQLYEDIGYQNSSIKITDSQLLENIQNIQKNNEIIHNKTLDSIPKINIGLNLTIDMETGTGKTYTYIRTMYELHKHYGWSKFVIIVPSIAIREGVFKSFDMTEEHFQEIYGHKINRFIYDSSRPQDIESFAADSRIGVMIINSQAFAARGAAARRIYQELDQFGSRKPIEILSQTKPILIIDEPQSVGRLGSKTLNSMEEFKPLFTLRYSATHAEVYNKIYRLDALDAYNMQLVKQIQVKGINIKGITGTSGYFYLEHISLSANKPPMAVAEFEERTKSGVKRVRRRLKQGTDLYQLSGELPAYKNMVITEIDGFQNKIVLAGEDVFPGDILNNKEDEALFRRIQIRETILSHLQKEREMFEKGVKVLSLFFIDEVAKYKSYNEEGEEQAGEYAIIFQEEYENAVNDLIEILKQKHNNDNQITDDYIKYIKSEAAKVHNGYFSIDKRSGKIINSTIKRGAESSDDVSAYELIMKNKERLLSFDEPTRFIFSHSALKEGWDNPNVFQICTLKNTESGSEIRRRQEVGRGMRLCVDKTGTRLDTDVLGDQVHQINKLTVIASESYEEFARGLQTEIAETLSERPVAANTNFFANKTLKNSEGQKVVLTKTEAENLVVELRVGRVIDSNYKVTDEGKELIEQKKITVPENLEPFVDDISELLKKVYEGTPPMPQNERKNTSVTINHNFAKKEFQELWNKISLKTIYEVNYDSTKLIEKSKERINQDLNINIRTYEIITGEQKQVDDKQGLKDGEGMYITKTEHQTVRAEIYSNTLYDMIGEIEALTNLKRSTIVEILQKIEANKFEMFKRNPEEFIAKTARLINETKSSLILNNIVYHKIDDKFDAKTVFTNQQNILRSDKILKKHIYDFINTDSKVEQEFATNLEQATEVVVYAKLPRSFYITTPVANYSPDWAIVLNKESVKHIYFVAETKGTDEISQLRSIEQLKIHCATEHFKAISGTEVKFDVIHNYSKLLEVAELK